MSYKVEQQTQEHIAVLGGALRKWSTQEPDVHLLSIEGHRIFTQRKLLSFYSSLFQRILNDPDVAFSQQNPSISLPASSTCISSLLKILVSGETQSVDKESLRDVLDLAEAIGIKLQNCIVDSNAKKTPNVFQFASEKMLSFKKSFEKVNNVESTTMFKRRDMMTEEKRWKCDICFKNYRGKKHLMKHKKRSHGDKVTEGTASVNGSTNDENTIIKQEVDDSSQKCTYCGEEFQYKKSLKKHLRNRHESKSLNCDSCDKAFKNSTELRQHQLIHLPDSEKPYQCELCLKRFCQKGQKNVHMKTKHSSQNHAGANVEENVGLGDPLNENNSDTSGTNTSVENETISDNLTESVVDDFDFD